MKSFMLDIIMIYENAYFNLCRGLSLTLMPGTFSGQNYPGFDWFASTIFLLMNGNRQRAWKFVQTFSTLAVSAYIWPPRIHASVSLLFICLCVRIYIFQRKKTGSGKNFFLSLNRGYFSRKDTIDSLPQCCTFLLQPGHLVTPSSGSSGDPHLRAPAWKAVVLASRQCLSKDLEHPLPILLLSSVTVLNDMGKKSPLE